MKEQVKIYCIGTQITDKGKKAKGFRFVNEDRTLQEGEFTFSGKGCLACYVGQVYTVKMEIYDNGDMTMYGSPLVFGNYHDNEQIAKDRLSSEANETLLTARAQSKKAATEKVDILELLRPLRKQYCRTNTQGQVALEARVLYYLRMGRDL